MQSIQEDYDAFIKQQYEALKKESKSYIELREKIKEVIRPMLWDGCQEYEANGIRMGLERMLKEEIDSILEEMPIARKKNGNRRHGAAVGGEKGDNNNK